MTIRIRAFFLGICLVGFFAGLGVSHAQQTQHILLQASDLKWGPGPDALPPGAQAVVLEGDPNAPGPFTMRFKTPGKYQIPPHTHPADEHVTVLSGTVHFGMGDQMDTTKGTAITAGGFAVMPKGMHHYAWTDGEAVIQLHGVGPWGITYIDPKMDPRQKAK